LCYLWCQTIPEEIWIFLGMRSGDFQSEILRYLDIFKPFQTAGTRTRFCLTWNLVFFFFLFPFESSKANSVLLSNFFII
jgi:hypothetical protein